MTLSGEPLLFADRGFTSHEYLEDFKLYNMNGRLYDPVVGRFLNADPVIQDPGNTQNFNRYSYCLNNPLKYSDPSGYIHSHYWLKSHDEFSSVINGDSNGGGGGGFGLPGRGGNGSGLNGTYYDWFSGTYRSTVSGNPEVSWNNVYYNLIATGNTYSTLDMGRHDRVYENAYRPNPDGKIRLFVTYTDCVILGGSGKGANFDISNLALDIGGGIYGALRTAVTPGDQWLGNNGKYYSNSWGGNKYTGSRSGAFAASNTYKWAGRATVVASAVIGSIQVYNGYQMDGGQFGYNANLAGVSATGSIVGGLAGAEAGATIGAGIGVWFGGVGAVPGAIIGGFIGGIAGSLTGNKVGEIGVNFYYGR